jgi:hypothetical protein
VRSGLAHPLEWYNSIGARHGASVGLTTAVEAILPSRPAPLILAAAGLLAAAGVAAPATGEEYHCRRNDLVRRVEVQFADDADRLPCQVVYWRDTERPGEKQVPWHAENQIEFCTGKAREMVERLQSSGWSCDREQPPAEDAAALDVAGAPEDSSREPPASDAKGPGKELENGPLQPDNPLLEEALARDIRRLEELTGALWQFEPDTATLGDLDGDGLEDGAVLLSHRDENGGVSHHLLAYRFDGTTFRPVARVALEAYYQNFKDVVVEDIGDGGIEVLLHTARAGDPECCPSGRKRATFELRDGQLVLAAESDSGA